MPTAPADHVLVRPLHLAGRGNPDFGLNLVTHFGWRVPPPTDDDEILLVSPDGQAHLAWRPATGQWDVTVPSRHWTRSGWTATFDDHAPSEIAAAVLYALAHALQHQPQEVLYAMPGPDAALGVLGRAGWAPQHRDGHEVLLAPDRLGALTRPLGSDDAPTVLTGAAERGTWTITFSSRTPAVLLQTAAATLLRPAVRPLDELPTAHRLRVSADPAPLWSAHRALVSPRRLAGAGTGSTPLPAASALWHRTRPGRVESSCGRALVTTAPGQDLKVSAGPQGPGHRLAWTTEFSGAVPSEITTAWLRDLTDSLTADIDLSTEATFVPGPGMSVGDAIEPLTAAGWIAHADDADLHLVAPDGHTSARITHGLLTPATTVSDALAHTTHWGASIDVTGAPGHHWRIGLSSLTPLHLVRAAALAVTDPDPVVRRPDRIPAQFLGAVHVGPPAAGCSPAALAARSRGTAPVSAAPRVSTTAVLSSPTPDRAARRPGH
ncbi:DUF317 domain-containing protein [Kitasatospora sp. A2-31]|uniref:DUF317 domain-containing protein n=1 Tax=Kitasatospora sp. A2-31 TaxID=2916414 RepID=UPI001EEB2A8F|nr:DUF317 domain-containing protein [Kitasatospora sp. A2-31]MCG6496949.1 DUF317 domain-containing protein [Kitasatospora sp. A2-31]